MKEIISECINEEMETGIRSVVYIRCMEHRTVPAYNHNEISGAECAACTIIGLQTELQSARAVILSLHKSGGGWGHAAAAKWLKDHPE